MGQQAGELTLERCQAGGFDALLTLTFNTGVKGSLSRHA